MVYWIISGISVGLGDLGGHWAQWTDVNAIVAALGSYGMSVAGRDDFFLIP
jgi:hypothetical protein